MKIQFWVHIGGIPHRRSFSSFENAEEFARTHVRLHPGARCMITDSYGTLARVCTDAAGRVWTDMLVMS